MSHNNLQANSMSTFRPLAALNTSCVSIFRCSHVRYSDRDNTLVTISYENHDNLYVAYGRCKNVYANRFLSSPFYMEGCLYVTYVTLYLYMYDSVFICKSLFHNESFWLCGILGFRLCGIKRL